MVKPKFLLRVKGSLSEQSKGVDVVSFGPQQTLTLERGSRKRVCTGISIAGCSYEGQVVIVPDEKYIDKVEFTMEPRSVGTRDIYVEVHNKSLDNIVIEPTDLLFTFVYEAHKDRLEEKRKQEEREQEKIRRHEEEKARKRAEDEEFAAKEAERIAIEERQEKKRKEKEARDAKAAEEAKAAEQQETVTAQVDDTTASPTADSADTPVETGEVPPADLETGEETQSTSENSPPKAKRRSTKTTPKK